MVDEKQLLMKNCVQSKPFTSYILLRVAI